VRVHVLRRDDAADQHDLEVDRRSVELLKFSPCAGVAADLEVAGNPGAVGWDQVDPIDRLLEEGHVEAIELRGLCGDDARIGRSRDEGNLIAAEFRPAPLPGLRRERLRLGLLLEHPEVDPRGLAHEAAPMVLELHEVPGVAEPAPPLGRNSDNDRARQRMR